MAETRKALEELLSRLGESAAFAACGKVTPVLPGLEVQGVGPIGFPLTAADASRLIAEATQAPYGRGEETIVDVDVRRVWQIEPGKFSVRNHQWDAHIAEMVDAVKTEFGIRRKVKAELYKLLVYEKGSFFASHRDSEKTPGMFATLVVCLPSRHEGGTLVVQHDGKKVKFDFGGNDSEFQTQYAAFYADCRHEIRPVTEGYRICLVYNLAIAGKSQPAAPSDGDTTETAAHLLKELFADADDLSKIAIPFEHQYTEAGLDPRQLKGSDRTRAEVLRRAADLAECQCYFALLTHHQSGDVDYDTWGGHGYRRRNWYDDFQEEDDASDADMGEVFDEEMVLDHWLDAKGHEPSSAKSISKITRYSAATTGKDGSVSKVSARPPATKAPPWIAGIVRASLFFGRVTAITTSWQVKDRIRPFPHCKKWRPAARSPRPWPNAALLPNKSSATGKLHDIIMARRGRGRRPLLLGPDAPPYLSASAPSTSPGDSWTRFFPQASTAPKARQFFSSANNSAGNLSNRN